MRDTDLDSYLRQTTPSEEWHLAHPGEPSPVYGRTPRITVGGESVFLFDWKNTLREKTVALIKETRYTDIPKHVNRDMELSYVYSGSCGFEVNGSLISLGQGDTIIFDTDVVRSSPVRKGEDDIVISMAFRREFFDSIFLSRLSGGGVLTNFLFEAVSNRRSRDRHLLLEGRFAGNVGQIMSLIMRECFFPDPYSDALVRSYVGSLFLEMTRGLFRRSEQLGATPAREDSLVRVLDYIERAYKECTLASTAARFGYNANYLGNLLRQRTGQTFGQIKLGQQMAEAAYLLLNTDRSVASIAAKVGISNMSYFYRKFAGYYRMTPKEYRAMMAGSG